jgi:hypothetical protein
MMGRVANTEYRQTSYSLVTLIKTTSNTLEYLQVEAHLDKAAHEER